MIKRFVESGGVLFFEAKGDSELLEEVVIRTPPRGGRGGGSFPPWWTLRRGIFRTVLLLCEDGCCLLESTRCFVVSVFTEVKFARPLASWLPSCCVCLS